MSWMKAGDAVWRTARKELQEWARDTRLRGALVGIAVLGIVASLAGAHGVTTRAKANRSAQDAEYSRWLSQPPRDPHSASHFGMSVFHNPSRLAILDPGVGAYAGSSLFLEAHIQNEPAYAAALDSGAAQRLGALSLAAALQMWLPLVIITLAAGAFAFWTGRPPLRLIRFGGQFNYAA